MLVEGDSGHGWNCFLDKHSALLIGSEFEQALAEVIAEWVDHELREVIFDLLEDNLHVLTLALF